MPIQILLSLRLRGASVIGLVNNKLMSTVKIRQTILILCTLALACVGTGVHAQNDEGDASVASAIERAQAYYEGGRNNEALTVVDEVLSQSPGNPEARFLKGLVFADMGRNEQAIEVFAALTSDYPELPEPWNNLAVLFAENGDFDKARQALLAAIQTHPSYSTAHENLGDLYARMAGMAYDRALEQDRGNESARLKLSAVNGLFSMPAAAPATTVAASDRGSPLQAATAPPNERPAPPPEPVAASEPEPAAVREPSPPVAVAEPPPAPEPEPAAASSSEQAVVEAVRSWAAAWSAQDVDGYLTSYAPVFRPSNGASRASWERYRRERLTAPSFISVDVSDFEVRMNGARSATATFTQRYRSDNYEDSVRKTLSMTLTDAGWQITSEASESS